MTIISRSRFLAKKKHRYEKQTKDDFNQFKSLVQIVDINPKTGLAEYTEYIQDNTLHFHLCHLIMIHSLIRDRARTQAPTRFQNRNHSQNRCRFTGITQSPNHARIIDITQNPIPAPIMASIQNPNPVTVPGPVVDIADRNGLKFIKVKILSD